MSSALLRNTITLLVLWTGISYCAPTVPKDDTTLPVIDLGYVKQRATAYNESLYIFKNIRFAAPPLGDLRFRKPEPPLQETEIQDGNIEDTACAQNFPSFLSGLSYDISFGKEDCLFLDVYVPKSVKPTDRVPVLAWFYGGAYILGSKDLYGDPAGLIGSSDKPIIYVASNYRLGAFGFLSDAEKDIDLNIGLHDTRAAMDWIRDYISSFGGDSDRVTVMGESAGGGVIMHSITAYGGEGSPPPFKQAIIQSPGFVPRKGSPEIGADAYNIFESAANCTDIKCLREAPTEVLIAANKKVTSNTTFGLFTPVVDGDYVPDLPMRLLAQGKFYHNVKSIISTSTRFEARYFVPSPDNVTAEYFDSLVQSFFPHASDSVVQTLSELYPKANDQVGEWNRITDLYGDVIFNCNAASVAQAFRENGYRYIFNVSRAYHGDDITYTFFNPGNSSSALQDWVATIHQEYITDYTVYGRPGCAGTRPCFTKYGPNSDSLIINATAVDIIRDVWDNDRCTFLQTKAWE